jgi:hypothetical protein
MTGGKPPQLFQMRGLIYQRFYPPNHCLGSEGYSGLGIFGNRLDPLKGSVLSRGINRDCNYPCIQTAKKSSNEFQSRGIKEESPFPLQSHRLQPAPDGPSLPVQFGVGNMDLLVFPVYQKCESNFIRLVGGPMAE